MITSLGLLIGINKNVQKNYILVKFIKKIFLEST